jgi:hypothetical protein
MSSLERISCLINSLTNDEDIRQDLWLHYLNGNAVETFQSKLERLIVEYSDYSELQESIWVLIKNPISDSLSDTLENNFTDYERSIICLIVLGVGIEEISRIKGISEVRIRQSIATIRYNECWEKIYGTQKEPNRRRKVRLKRRRD